METLNILAKCATIYAILYVAIAVLSVLIGLIVAYKIMKEFFLKRRAINEINEALKESSKKHGLNFKLSGPVKITTIKRR